MKNLPRANLWLKLLFILLSIFSILAGKYLWMLSFYYMMMAILALMAIGVGGLLILTSNARWRMGGLVILGLLIGQWWFTEQAILILGWAISGFAP